MVLKQYKLTSFGETKRLLTISDVLCNQLAFKEKLYVFDEDGKRVGRFSINITTMNIQESTALVVHISNRGFFDGSNSESIVTGIVTLNMKTLEEIRYEASDMRGGRHERRFYLLRERTKYYYSIRESVCDIEHKRHKTISFGKSIGLIGEAANIVLMRSIAIRGVEGIFCLKTVLSNGKKCRNYYISKSAKRTVNGRKIDIMVIYRSVTDHKKYSVTSTCSFTKAGQLLDLFWSNSGYFIHIDPDLEINDRMVDENRTVGLHRHWNRDKQIFSYYLDKKVEMEGCIRSYRVSNQESKRLLGDWLQFVLIFKPPDIIGSAREYFTSFEKRANLISDKSYGPH